MRLKFGDQNKKKKEGSVRGAGVWNETGVGVEGESGSLYLFKLSWFDFFFLFLMFSFEAAGGPAAGLRGGARGQGARDSPPRPAPARSARGRGAARREPTGRTCLSPCSRARRERGWGRLLPE